MNFRILIIIIFNFLCLNSGILSQHIIQKNEYPNWLVGMNISASETQIQGALFKKNLLQELAPPSLGFEIHLGYQLKSQLQLNLGILWQAIKFDAALAFSQSFENPEHLDNWSETFTKELNTSVSQYKLIYDIEYNRKRCSNFQLPTTTTYEFGVGLRGTPRVQSIGIPFSLKKYIGQKSLKLFIGGGINTIFNFQKSSFSNGVIIQSNDPNSLHLLCYQSTNDRTGITVNNPRIEFLGYNIIENRFDFLSEVGFSVPADPTDSNSALYEVSIFYAHSMTPFTRIDNKKYRSQQVGIKFSYSRFIPKK